MSRPRTVYLSRLMAVESLRYNAPASRRSHQDNIYLSTMPWNASRLLIQVTSCVNALLSVIRSDVTSKKNIMPLNRYHFDDFITQVMIDDTRPDPRRMQNCPKNERHNQQTSPSTETHMHSQPAVFISSLGATTTTLGSHVGVIRSSDPNRVV